MADRPLTVAPKARDIQRLAWPAEGERQAARARQLADRRGHGYDHERYRRHAKAIIASRGRSTRAFRKENGRDPSLVETWFEEVEGEPLVVRSWASDGRPGGGTLSHLYMHPISPPPLSQAMGEEDARLNRNAWFKKRRQDDPIFALHARVRTQIRKTLAGQKGGQRWQVLVGYTLEDLRAHIEARFVDGMGWHNMGEWHIDHVRPLASFSITGPDCPEFRAAWALENLQPLWAKDNLRKGARWDG